MAERQWYAVQVYAGAEKKIAEQIKVQAERAGLTDQIEEVLIPSERVTQLVRGKKVDSDQIYFPGYLLVKMDMTDEAWHLIRHIPKVTAFLGSRTKPRPISEVEAAQMLKQTREGSGQARPKILFDIGSQVKVIDGPFMGFNGAVEEVDQEKSRLKVSVSIFGRSTPVDLEYTQVEPV